MRILIVDDNAVMRKVLSALFVNAGHEVVGALPDGTGLEARLPVLRPELVCLDYNLPGRDGMALLKVINTLLPEVDVLFMTASDEAGLEGRAADAGASGFIRKPFSQPQIIAELAAVSETRRVASKAVERATPGVGGGPGSGGSRRQRTIVGTAVIADDSGSIRLVLKGLLEECGLRVVQAVTNGAEAVQAARNHLPRVLCLDLNMPVMSGLEALPKIHEVSPETLIVIVSGCADKQQVAQAAGLGAVGYIIKPLRPAYVEDFIRKLLGG